MSETVQTLVVVAIVLALIGGLYWLCTRFMRPFHYRAFICLLAVIVGGWVTYGAAVKFVHGQGGFKLGVDLVGGTILVYEVDANKLRASADGEKALDKLEPAKMVEMLKRRVDPNDLYNVTIRPTGGKLRYEIILPTGGAHQANIKQKAWDELLAAVKENPAWKDALAGKELEIDRDRDRELINAVKSTLDAKPWVTAVEAFRTKFADKLKDVVLDPKKITDVTAVTAAVKAAGVPAEDVKKFFDENYQPASVDAIRDFIAKNYQFANDSKKQDFSSESIENVKLLISKQGSLEFRIAANEDDDARAFEEAKRLLQDPANRAVLDTRAKEGLPPPPIAAVRGDPASFSYTWVELGKTERRSLNLTNEPQGPRKASDPPPSRTLYDELANARKDGKIYDYKDNKPDRKRNRSGTQQMYLYSRLCQDKNLPDEEVKRKQVEYFMLLRDPGLDERDQPKIVSGKYLRSAEVDNYQQSVSFVFDPTGSRLFGELTTANAPSPRDKNNPNINVNFRFLAIVLDGQVMSAPTLDEPITGGTGQITMEGSPPADRAQLVKILRSGALPATLKESPVSESTIGPTLGGDTISKGLWSVGLAFGAVMIFMMWYYEFAGIVACTALIVNLLLTIAFMVFVNATFTLPGLAGLVLMLGMAVDANVLIYERIREEKDRGAGLSLALRNGYDRAFPTIIDTHLTSFFTAIVLYAVGNDQLRGFGISLASGLVISLFTSLYMTRLIFDVWQYKGWLKKLDMRRFFTKTSIDFMGIRYYMFAATTAMTVVGLAVFLARGPTGLNVDFVGGTAFSGMLKDGKTSGELRERLHDQKELLTVESAKQLDEDGKRFELTYKNYGATKKPTVEFVEPILGLDATKAAREAAVVERTSSLPDWSVEQIFVAGDKQERSDASRYFRVRTTEKEADLVQLSVDRLLSAKDPVTGSLETMLKSPQITGYEVEAKDRKVVTLKFSEPASPGYLKLFLEREFKLWLGEQSFSLRGEGPVKESRYKEMVLTINAAKYDELRAKEPGRLDDIMKRTQTDFGSRPQPEQLEKFDAQLAAETSNRALYAILASWLVILLYLWFRFGNWTFGLATVVCLIHDLCFTLGCIAACHYLVRLSPGLASFLLIDDFKIDLPSVAALLTLVGYSVNDTIVVFDRIREVRGKNPQLTPQMINDAINQALSRTLLASTTVFLVVSVLYVFGGESIRLFSFVMCVGVVVGTYSSIYVASPLLLIFGEGRDPRGVRPVKVPERVQA